MSSSLPSPSRSANVTEVVSLVTASGITVWIGIQPFASSYRYSTPPVVMIGHLDKGPNFSVPTAVVAGGSGSCFTPTASLLPRWPKISSPPSLKYVDDVWSVLPNTVSMSPSPSTSYTSTVCDDSST